MYLDSRRNGFRFQIAVPSDLHARIGKSPVRVPLGRISTMSARQFARLLSGQAERLFIAIRAGELGAMKQDDMRDEIIRELTDMVDKLTDQARRSAAIADRRIEIAVQKTEASMLIEQLRRQDEMGSKLERLGGGIASVKTQVERMREKASPETGKLEEALAALTRQFSELSQEVRTSLDGGPERPLLSVVLEQWIDIRSKLDIGIKKVKTDYNRIKDFSAFAGDKPVNKYTYFDFQRWSNLLVLVPQNHDKIPAIRHLSREEAVEYNNNLKPSERLPTLTEKTIDTNYLSPLRVFFREAAAEHSFRSPLAEVEIRISSDAAESVARLPFSVAELNLWFVTAAKHDRADMRWLPLLGSITGARIGELVFLQGKDVYRMEAEDGTAHWVMDLRTKLVSEDGSEEKRRIKNVSSRRLIALHECFDTIGFIAYAKTRRATEWLFPAAFYHGKARVQDPADAASKRMNRMLREVGIHKKLELVFHSTRHSAKDLMRMARIDERTHDLQTGHAFRTASKAYGSKTLRAEEIQVLRSLPLPNGLDLSPYFT